MGKMSKQLKITDLKKKIRKGGTGLKHHKCQKGFNQSFFTTKNTIWYNYVLHWLPNKRKPLVFLPCASAKKTREKFGKKMFSHSTTHQFLSEITRCKDFEQVVLSEPLTIVPYKLEGQHPDYNVPPEDLTIQDEEEFMIRLSNWLNIVKRRQPKRKFVYYIGATHHYFILREANRKALRPFKIIYKIPEGGTRGYGKAAKVFKQEILDLESNGIKPRLTPPDLKKHIESRGRYTNRKFWEYIHVIQKKGRSKKSPKFQEENMPVASKKEYFRGFVEKSPPEALKHVLKAKGL